MAININVPAPKELRPRIVVLGVGGAGGNAVNNMIDAHLEGVEFVVANTDAQALAQNKCPRRIQLGAAATEGLGAGAQPDVGRLGAEESLPEILEALSGAHMVFITAGMGGGTGTGAAPVIARAVREAGILTVGVVTKPFSFEGDKRMRAAERGIAELQAFVHTLIVIPNQNLFRVANDRTTFAQAFAMADEVLHAGVRGVTDLIVMPGLINLDFADIKSVISEMGKAMMGTGEAEGEDRAAKAADMAISNPLLDDVTMKGAKGVLINITGGPDLMLFEVEQAANRIRAEVDPDANIIFGNTILDEMEGRIRVSVVATGIDAEQMMLPEKKVMTLRTPFKPQPVKTAAPQPAPQPVASPVHIQVEAIAAELGAAAVAPSQAEEYILGGEDAPEVPVEVRYPVIETVRTTGEMPLAKPVEQKKGGWGLFGRKKAAPAPDLRAEPAPAYPKPQPQRSTNVQPLPAEKPAGGPSDDLFPEHGSDEQFEIPAFLRRQSSQ
ncbi:MAG: cell division protein FtsZ [Alphaproteobacteria bacterium]|nr:cell division protein FtsZ [Alphaproteobacteria bacterium]